MRHGWRPEWDWVERTVWTGVAFVWAFALVAAAILTPFSVAGMPLAQAIVGPLIYYGFFWLAIAHGFVFVGLWLRQMLQPPFGKDRDR